MKQVFLVAVIFLAACGRNEAPPRRAETPPAAGAQPADTAGAQYADTARARPEETAADTTKAMVSGGMEAGTEEAVPVVFRADSAWTFLERQVAFGSRVPGTEAHRRCERWLVDRLERWGAAVEPDRFEYRDGDGETWPLVNIVARFGPTGGGRLLLVAHWDSRPWADRDPDPQRRNRPFPAANDGASGVAVLLEIGRNLARVPPPRGVDLLFTDGEDLGREGSIEGFCRGTIRFAARGVSQYRRAIVVDMVGDADLRIPVEGYSLRQAPEVVDWVWKRARRLSPQVFSTNRGPFVYDDHMPLLQAGLPAVDLIDFDYPYWHTARDDLDAVSAASLEAVGRVLLSLVYSP